MSGRSIVIRCEGRPPTPNARFGNYHAEASELKRWKVAAEVDATNAINAIGGRRAWGAPIELADVFVTFVIPNRAERDLDNLVASSKPLTDGIVSAGVLAGDSLRHLRRVTYDHRLEKGLQATIYEIREVDPDQPGLALELPEAPTCRAARRTAEAWVECATPATSERALVCLSGRQMLPVAPVCETHRTQRQPPALFEDDLQASIDAQRAASTVARTRRPAE